MWNFVYVADLHQVALNDKRIMPSTMAGMRPGDRDAVYQVALWGHFLWILFFCVVLVHVFLFFFYYTKQYVHAFFMLCKF